LRLTASALCSLNEQQRRTTVRPSDLSFVRGRLISSRFRHSGFVRPEIEASAMPDMPSRFTVSARHLKALRDDGLKPRPADDRLKPRFILRLEKR
jgi:hypothetical protein